MEDKLEQIISQVKENRVDQIDVYGTESAPLRGECFENTYTLGNKLNEMGYSPKIVLGGLAFPDFMTPKTFSEAYERGQHHIWIQLHQFHLDLSGEWMDSSKEGNMICSSTVPDHYIIYRVEEFKPRHDSVEQYL